MTPDDLLPPTPTNEPPSPGPEPTPAAGNIHCGFCKTEITRARGEIIALGPRAKQLRDNADELEDANRDIAELKTRIEELEAIIREKDTTIGKLNADLKKATSGFWR